MNIQCINNKLVIKGVHGFDIDKTFGCGQCFRFDKQDGKWSGVAYERPLTLYRSQDEIVICGVTQKEFEDIFVSYFDLERDYGEIEAALLCDPVLRPVVPFSSGIRILRQQPFETLVSFIISASNNIPRIKKIISALCENFGRRIESGGKSYYAFPTPDRLAACSLPELAVLRAGFRDKYILDCAKKVSTGKIDLDAIFKMSYEDGAAQLMKINGVGRKVADCVLLFAYNKLESFPKDVWIKRVLKSFYGTDDNAGIDFHGYDGIAQQYLYYYARENSIK